MTTSAIRRAAICGMALTFAAGVASAETRVRVKNDSDIPANITIDKRSRDVRDGKSGAFPITGTTAVLTVAFANGEANRGDLDVSMEEPVTSVEDGNQYYCVLLDRIHFEVQLQSECEAIINKPKK